MLCHERQKPYLGVVPILVMLFADYNATSPLAPGVASAMEPYLHSQFGNPSSTFHELGASARDAIESARRQVAQLVGASPAEVVFFSDGTESCAHALIGAAQTSSSQCRIVYSAVEHLAVRETIEFLRRFRGCKTSEVKVDAEGALDERQFFRECEASKQVIVSLMSANNETGVYFPIQRLAARCRKDFSSAQDGSNEKLVFHTDAVQTVGKELLNFSSLSVDLLSLSAHKFGGPKGVGALVIREGLNWEPVVRGGGQEGGRRGGTEAVASIVGMGEAARIRREELESGKWFRVEQLREQFEQMLLKRISDVSVHGKGQRRLGNTSSLLIAGINSRQLRADLAQQGVIVASGSACFSAQLSPSHVLRAMGKSVVDCLSTIRVSLGVETSESDIERLVSVLASQVEIHRNETARIIDERLISNTG